MERDRPIRYTPLVALMICSDMAIPDDVLFDPAYKSALDVPFEAAADPVLAYVCE